MVRGGHGSGGETGWETVPRYTLAAPGAAVYEAKRSRFYAYARPLRASSGLQAPELRVWLSGIRERHRDARHVVFGWRDARGTGRGTDDGEPHGTGGRPCLAALGHAGVDAAAVAVARIFGGVLLGPAGLARAYGEAAAAAVAAAGVRSVMPVLSFTVDAPIADGPAVERVLRSLRAECIRREYPVGAVRLCGVAPPDAARRLMPGLAAATGGRARATLATEPEWD